METPSMIRRGSGYNLRSKGSGGYNLRSKGSGGYNPRSKGSGSTSRRCSRDSLSSSKFKVKKLKKSPNKIGAKRDDNYEDQMTECANLALQQYNSDVGSNFKLVKNGSTGAAFIPSIGLIRHVSFKAKDQDDPQARMKTFFTEVITKGCQYHSVSVSKCLGETVSLPRNGDNHGCIMCWPGLIHHPSDGDFYGKHPSEYRPS
ncbi:hypothetical protein OROMI_033589 [Orobanche minor]